jgi:hypothetical protein
MNQDETLVPAWTGDLSTPARSRSTRSTLDSESRFAELNDNSDANSSKSLELADAAMPAQTPNIRLQRAQQPVKIHSIPYDSVIQAQHHKDERTT